MFSHNFGSFWSRVYRHNLLPGNRISTLVETSMVLTWMLSTILFYSGAFSLLPKSSLINNDATIIIVSYFITDGLIFGLLYRNLSTLSLRISDRRLDELLLLPVSFKNYASFRLIQLSSLLQIPMALFFLIVTYHNWSLSSLLWMLSLGLGFLIGFHLWYILCLCSFWVKVGDKLDILFQEISGMGMFPLLPFLSSKLLILFVPFLSIAAFPAYGMNNQYIHLILAGQILMLGLLILLAKVMENAGLKRYRS